MNKKEMTSLLESNLKARLEGLWANINAKKKRGEKSAPKGSKAYKAAKKAGDKLEKTKEGFELDKEKFTDPDQMRMNNEAVYDKMLKAVPKFYSYKAFAADVAKMIKQEYGSHLIKGFIKELTKHLMSKDESIKVTEAFKKGDKVKYLGHPAIITKVKEYRGRLFYSVSYNKGNGKTKASDILSTDGTITEGDLSEAREKFITKSGPYELFRTVRHGGMVTHIVKKKGREWKQYPPNFKANVVLSNFKREFGGK